MDGSIELKAIRNILEDMGIYDYELISHRFQSNEINELYKYFDRGKIVQSIVIRTENGFYVLLTSHARKIVDYESFNSLLECNEFDIATKKDMVERLGIESNNLPILGHELPCIFDRNILRNDYVYGATGDLFHTLRIRTDDLIKTLDIVYFFE